MKQKINITIDETLWRQFRAQCIQQGKSASSAIEEFIKSQLPEAKKSKKKKEA